MVIPDFNAHIGHLIQISDEIFLSPNLYNMTNASGNKLVESMEHLGSYTLNGRIKWDIPVKFTFINQTGKSIIDLAWFNINHLGKVRNRHFNQFPIDLSNFVNNKWIYMKAIKNYYNEEIRNTLARTKNNLDYWRIVRSSKNRQRTVNTIRIPD